MTRKQKKKMKRWFEYSKPYFILGSVVLLGTLALIFRCISSNYKKYAR